MGRTKTTALDAMTDEELAERAALFGDDDEPDEEGDGDDGIDHVKLARVMREATEHARRVRVDLDLSAMEPAPKQLDVRWLATSLVRVDGGTQSRVRLDETIVKDYAQEFNRNGQMPVELALKSSHELWWGDFPPLDVYFDQEYWLADGFHRLAGLRQALEGVGLDGYRIRDWRVKCRIFLGSRRDAILHAAGANANHGLRRTNADKRKAVETLLRDEEWQKWTDGAVAKACAVDPKTVGSVRERLINTQEIHSEMQRKTVDGRVMDTTNIGRKPEQRVIEPVRKPTTTPTVEPTEPVYGVPSLKVEGFVHDLLYMRIDSETFRFALEKASIQQLEAAWRRVPPISERDRFAQIGNRRELLLMAKDAQVVDEVIEAAMPTPSKIEIINRDLDAYDAAMKQEIAEWQTDTKPDLTPADLRDEGIVIEESTPNYFRWVDTDESRYRVGALHDTAEQAIASARKNFGIYEADDAPAPEIATTPDDIAAAGFAIVPGQHGHGWRWRRPDDAGGAVFGPPYPSADDAIAHARKRIDIINEYPAGMIKAGLDVIERDKAASLTTMPDDLAAAGYTLIDTKPGPGWRWYVGAGKSKASGPLNGVAWSAAEAIAGAREHYESFGAQRAPTPLGGANKAKQAHGAKQAVMTPARIAALRFVLTNTEALIGGSNPDFNEEAPAHCAVLRSMLAEIGE